VPNAAVATSSKVTAKDLKKEGVGEAENGSEDPIMGMLRMREMGNRRLTVNLILTMPVTLFVHVHSCTISSWFL
uniref:Uncharacterized protein n=1 Tax=Moschus moschiferus TaxID=68415 RepID=A0A8C6E728_MOSMO